MKGSWAFFLGCVCAKVPFIYIVDWILMDKLVFKSLCALCISSSQLAMTMQTSNVVSIITFWGLSCCLKYYYVNFGSSKICYSSISLLLVLYKNLNQNRDLFVLPMWINCAHWLIFNVFQLNHLNTFNLCVGGLHEVCIH